MPNLPNAALAFGFVNPPGGTHTSRTMMLSELRLLLAACPPSAAHAEYRAAILEENCLLKHTATTRLRSLRALRELYGLDRRVLIFRALRDLWDVDESAQSLLACLCANARDPLLRSSAGRVLAAVPGESVTAVDLSEAVSAAFRAQYNPSILSKIGRNAASSWSQSGHLTGHDGKVRNLVAPGPVVAAYALLLGYLCNSRGENLFGTFWTRLLDASASQLHEHAFAASRLGWLEYRRAGDVTDVHFSYLLREEKAGE